LLYDSKPKTVENFGFTIKALRIMKKLGCVFVVQIDLMFCLSFGIKTRNALRTWKLK